jgi:hypothetical protein
MKTESSETQSRMLQARLDLLHREVAGHLDGLHCPECGQCRVSVWYTHPSPQAYRTWFICDNCGFEMRVQNSGRPEHYSSERDRTGRGESKSYAKRGG